MKKQLLLMIFASVISLCAACGDSKQQRSLSPIDDPAVYSDKSNRYRTMSFIVQSYVDYLIFDIHIMPIDGSSLSDAVRVPAVVPESATNKSGGMGEGGWIAWDTTWKTPKQFKIWWQRATDIDLLDSDTPYNKYTEKRAQPGSAWCEEIITVDRPFTPNTSRFVLHFFPDGHIEATTSALHHPRMNAPIVLFEDRSKLPMLKEKACKREISNPYFGMEPPLQIN